MEKVLISKRPDVIRFKKAAILSLLKTANELADLYRELRIGEFTIELLKDALNGGDQARRLYVASAEQEASMIKSIALRNEVLESAKEWNTPYAKRLQTIRSWVSSGDRQLVKYLSINDTGNVVFTEEGEKRLEEDTYEYLTEPDEIEKYKQHKQIVDLLNKFFEDGKLMPPIWTQAFPNFNGRFITAEQGLFYKKLLRKI